MFYCLFYFYVIARQSLFLKLVHVHVRVLRAFNKYSILNIVTGMIGSTKDDM